MPKREIVEIQSRDIWVKLVEMLQQNWALIDVEEDGRAHVFFLGDTSGVFDEMTFPTLEGAKDGLRWNGFQRFTEDEKLQEFLRPPQPPFWRSQHPNGLIYSSGRFWRDRPRRRQKIDYDMEGLP